MQIEVSEGDQYCVVKCHYEASKEEIEAKKDEVLLQFKDAPVKGFRKGGSSKKVKPDMTAIRIQYSREIQESLKRAMAEKAFHDTIFEKDIKPFGQPEFTAVSLLNDKFSCDFQLRKKPEFVLGQYKDFEIPQPPEGTSPDALAQSTLQDLRIRYGEGIPFVEGDVVCMTDNVIVDYDVFEIGQPVDEGTQTLTKIEPLCGEAQLLTVGRSKLKEFDQNLLGMKAGDKREFSITMPDFGMPSVVNKELRFTVSLTSASKIKPNPLDDSLAVKCGKKDLQELMASVNEMASAQAQEQTRTTKITAVSNRLVAEHEIKVPDWLTISEAQYLTTSAKMDWKTMQKIDQDKYIELAERNVKLSIILDKIREVELETQLADQEVIGMIRGMVSRMTQDEKEIDRYLEEMNKSNQLVILASRIRDEHALDFVVKNTKWIE